MNNTTKDMTNEEQLVNWINQVKFKKSLFGGVNERDVWKKLTELHALYQAALQAERVRYDTLLSQYQSSKVTTLDEGDISITERTE